MTDFINPLFCLLKDGRKMVVFSDNTHQETMHVFPVADLQDFDPEYQRFEEVPYSAIARTDRNRVVAYAGGDQAASVSGDWSGMDSPSHHNMYG